MNDIKLKPCPFCGSDDLQIEEIENFGGTAVVCKQCGGQMHTGFCSGYGRKIAVERWNRRTENEGLKSIINEVREPILRELQKQNVSEPSKDWM